MPCLLRLRKTVHPKDDKPKEREREFKPGSQQHIFKSLAKRCLSRINS